MDSLHNVSSRMSYQLASVQKARDIAVQCGHSDPVDQVSLSANSRPAKTAAAPEPSAARKFWKGAAMGGGVAALGCLLFGAALPIGVIVAGSAALVCGVSARDGGISDEKLAQLEEFRRFIDPSAL